MRIQRIEFMGAFLDASANQEILDIPGVKDPSNFTGDRPHPQVNHKKVRQLPLFDVSRHSQNICTSAR